jgi:hypothetical protein
VYLGWFTTVALVLYICFAAIGTDIRLVSRPMLIKWAVFGALSVLILLPIHLPYYTIKLQWGVVRTLQECTFFSADLLLSYLNVPVVMNDLYRSLFGFIAERSWEAENWLFLGFILPSLVILASLPTRSAFPMTGFRPMRQRYWVILMSAFILSLGPYLIVLGKNTHLPLPYLILYYLVPGFHSMRVPARFAFLVTLAASVLAAIGFLRAHAFLHTRGILRKLTLPIGQAILALCLLSLFALELGFKSLPLTKIPTDNDVPEVYRWLAVEKPGPIVELPIGMPYIEPYMYFYMYFSTYHWLPIVNGWSGFLPPSYLQIVRELQGLPSREAVEFLSAIGIRALVLHRDRLPPQKALYWSQVRAAAVGLEEVAAFGSDLVYTLPTVEVTQQVHTELPTPGQLPIGAQLRLGLLAKADGHRPWAHPQPLGQTRAIVVWEEAGNGRTSTQEVSVHLPLAIRANEVVQTEVPLRTPGEAGRYWLRLRLPSLGLSTAPQHVELTAKAMPTSRDAPQLLAASYGGVVAPTEAPSTQPVEVQLQVVNTGAAVWLAAAEEDRGTVRLRWQWHQGASRVPAWSGRAELSYDVFPGGTHLFRVRIPTPGLPGEYVLELDMVSELVTYFTAQPENPSLRRAIRLYAPLEGQKLP